MYLIHQNNETSPKSKEKEIIDVESDDGAGNEGSDSDSIDPFDLDEDVIPVGPDQRKDPLRLEKKKKKVDDEIIPLEYKNLNQSTSILPKKGVPQPGPTISSPIRLESDDDDDDVIPLQDVDPLGDIEMQPAEVSFLKKYFSI